MAIYEYWCGNCKQEFELMRPMSQSADPGHLPNVQHDDNREAPVGLCLERGLRDQSAGEGRATGTQHTRRPWRTTADH